MKMAQLAALALAGVLAGGTLAQAQEPPAGGPPPPMAGKGGGRDRDPAAMQARRAERLKSLHDALNIKPDQEAAFTAFAQAMAPPAPGAWRDGMKDDRQAMAAMTTPERLDRMSQMMDQRMARMKDQFAKRAAATKTLYAALSPDQKRTMDALPGLARGGEIWGGRGRGGHDGRGPGGPGGPGMGAG